MKPVKSLLRLITLPFCLVPLTTNADSVAIYSFDNPITETGKLEPNLLDFNIDLFPDKSNSFHALIQSLKHAETDDELKGVLLELAGSGLGIAQIQELRRSLEKIRDAGKDVWLYSDSFSNGIAYVGSVANHFAILPEGNIDFNGVVAESLYLKGFFDKVGISPQVVHIGDFKSAGETFTRSGPSEADTLQREELLNGTFDQIMTAISETRNISREKLDQLVDQPIVTAQDLLDHQLVDHLQYRSEFNQAARAHFGDDTEFIRNYQFDTKEEIEIDGIFSLIKLFTKSSKKAAKEDDFIAVVALEGGIDNASVAPVRKEILRLAKNDSAKGLVLRVNSPGGSAIASDILWQATEEWKATGKPFVVSMGDVAASGGYYIAAGADQIFAEPATITGSIGVFGMVLCFEELMNEWGVTSHSIQIGKHADLISVTHKLTPEQEDIIRTSMQQTYTTFKNRITTGRGHRLQGEIESLAGGRVYTGQRAKELGLVDELGGLHDAIAYLAEQLELTPFDSKLLPEEKSWIDEIFGSSENKDEDDSELIKMPDFAQSPVTKALSQLQTPHMLSSLPAAYRHHLITALRQIQASDKFQVNMFAELPVHNLNLR